VLQDFDSEGMVAGGAGGLDTLLRTLLKHYPQDHEYKDATQALEKIDELRAKRTPADRHSTRLRALYVDLNESGIAWNRPCELSPTEATNCLVRAVGDYAVQRDRLQPAIVREMDPSLASGLEAWVERPELPVPPWPEVE
jgi:hypothetical protein